MRIGIIGAGIAGLTAARLLSRAHDISVFEAARYPGGHANTVLVPDQGRTVPIDTGFIVFNEPNYPILCRLFEELGVPHHASDMSFSVHCERTGREWNGSSFRQVFADPRNLVRPSHWGMLWDIHRFHSQAQDALCAGLSDQVTVAEWLRQKGYGRGFTQHYLLPLGASLWSCSQGRFETFPMRFVIEFLSNHRMLQVDQRPGWRTVTGGSREYVSRMIAPFARRIRLNCPVRRVVRHGQGVDVTDARGRVERFDEVVLACHANQSLALLCNPDDTERSVLESFPYQPNEAVLHTDVTLLPDREAAWASWNYRIPPAAVGDVTVTYDMTRLQGLDTARRWCVSLNPAKRVNPAKVERRFRYDHPVFTPGRDRAQAAHSELIRRRGISYCGAYWGFGFHEDGARSALAVCEAFHESLAQAA